MYIWPQFVQTFYKRRIKHYTAHRMRSEFNISCEHFISCHDKSSRCNISITHWFHSETKCFIWLRKRCTFSSNQRYWYFPISMISFIYVSKAKISVSKCHLRCHRCRRLCRRWRVFSSPQMITATQVNPIDSKSLFKLVQ